MILVDTSVWVEHLRSGNRGLAELLESQEVLTHPFVIGELACGTLHARAAILALLDRLPAAPEVTHPEALNFLSARRLHGRGLGWIDVHLLASSALAGAPIWTLDRRLAAVAASLVP